MSKSTNVLAPNEKIKLQNVLGQQDFRAYGITYENTKEQI